MARFIYSKLLFRLEGHMDAMKEYFVLSAPAMFKGDHFSKITLPGSDQNSLHLTANNRILVVILTLSKLNIG